ncbi:MAG TPA: hypothetical protein VF945_12660 [Polyangia bacterium]
MKTMMMAMVVAGALATGGVAAARGGALDGKSFSGTVGEKGKTTGDAEVLTFKDGKLHSKACDQYGFGDGAYTASTAGGVTTFEADTTSAKEGKMHWRGTVKGAAVEGSYVWTKAGQAPVEGWFKTK